MVSNFDSAFKHATDMVNIGTSIAIWMRSMSSSLP
jgi:hypothetical protein